MCVFALCLALWGVITEARKQRADSSHISPLHPLLIYDNSRRCALL
jgi:hypothetical protein